MELKIKGVSLIKCTLKPGESEVVIPRGVRIIEWAAFSSCTNLRRVVLPEGLFEIRRGAFQGCRLLASVNLPERLKHIYESAFADCTSLRVISIPDSVTMLGARAFENCTSLMQVRLSASLSRIDQRAFHKCTSLQKIALPDSLRELGQGAFEGCTALMQARCPNTMTAIEERAFRLCTSLKQLKMPEKLQQIGDQTFEKCTSLTSLILPEGITRLSDELCKDCSSLTQLVLPSTLDNRVSRYSYGAFDGCVKLTRIIARGTLCEAVRYSLSDVQEQLVELYVSSPEAFASNDCFLSSRSRSLMLIALRTYAGNQTRFSEETQKNYHFFLSLFASSLCSHIIEHADIIDLICRKDLLKAVDMTQYIDAALEHPAQLGRLLRYICKKKQFSKEEILSLLEKTTSMEHSEATAVLLQYQNEHFPAEQNDKDEDDPFFLPDWDDDF